MHIVLYTPQNTGHEDQQWQGKLIQFRWRGQEYLVFAPFEIHRYHNQILGHFLKDHGIVHCWLDEQRLEIDDPGLRVIGGGRFRLDLARHSLELWDDSQTYGRFDELGLAGKIARAGEPWGGLRLKVS
jgi:hypothetical protein